MHLISGTHGFSAFSLFTISQLFRVGTASTSCKAEPIEVDVVVVGGGFSGLTSAYELHKAELSTVVLEAKDRLGGRSRSVKRRSGDGIIELGAGWINNHTQPEVFALTQEFGLDTLEQYNEGFSLYEGIDGRVIELEAEPTVNTDDPELGLLEGEVLALMQDAANKTNIRNFQDFPAEDDVTIEEYIARRGLWEHPHIKAAISGLTSALVGMEPDQIGAHYLLDYITSGGGLVSLSTENKMGAQALLVKQGTTAIATGLADTLPEGSVHMNTPAESITQSEDKVLVVAKNGKSFKARKVILAIPTNTYADLTFTPPLPHEKGLLVSHTKPGVYAKMILSYAEPWWKDAGLVGKFRSVIGPGCFSWEASDPELDQYSLAMFTAGDIGADWYALPESEREHAIVEHLAEMVGKELADKARDTIEFNIAEWSNEEFIVTGPTSTIGPRLLREYGPAMREPFMALHFGGGEMAFEWKGYLEGAVTAGQTAAKEVIKALRAGNNK